MAEGKKYYIRVPEALVEVSEDVYLAYFRARRRWYAQSERDTYNGLVSYDAMDTEDILGEEMLPDQSSSGVEDAAIASILSGKLHRCLAQLDEPDRKLIHALYFEGLSERQFAKELGLHYMTVHSRKVSALSKLKKMMEN